MRSMLRIFLTVAATFAVSSVALAEPAYAAGLADFLRQNMAPVMFIALVFFLLLGYPVAFALAANGLV
ncbi:MAG: hypothetical protein ACRCYS_11235, partial [Beijerinckiaceae bacterium]